MYSKPITKFKINGLPTDTEFGRLPFGRQVELAAKIKEFKSSAQVIHLSQKRQSYIKAIQVARKLYRVDQYYCQFHNSPAYKDDGFAFFFTAKPE